MTSARKSIGTVQLFPDDLAIAKALEKDAASKSTNGVGSSDEMTQESALASEGETPPLLQKPPSETSMQDYYQLQLNLLRLTVVFGALIFPCVWFAYSPNTALNYLLGATTGVVYLRMLARSVGKIGREASPNSGTSSGRLAILIGVLVVATQWEQLSVLPVFLGFLTYKAALIAFVLWTAVMPSSDLSAETLRAEALRAENTATE